MSRTSKYTVEATKPAPKKKATSMKVTRAPPDSVDVGEEFVFAGYLQDEDGNRLDGMTVNLYADGSKVTSTTTDSEGRWGWKLKINEEATVTFYAEFPGTDRYSGCEVRS